MSRMTIIHFILLFIVRERGMMIERCGESLVGKSRLYFSPMNYTLFTLQIDV